MNLNPIIVKRFFARLNLPSNITNEDCWEWQGAINQGYGYYKFRMLYFYAHRLSWLIYNGDIPSNLFVLHKCDNRICVNPNHLYLGTKKENSHDLHIRGNPNHPTLENHPRAKLFNEDVLKILSIHKERKIKQHVLARKFNVGKSTIGRILRGECWNKLTNQNANQ